jgi:hypothetical protein
MLKLAVAVALGAVAWYWRKEIGSMLETQFPGVGEKTSRVLAEAGRSTERLAEQAKGLVGTQQG